MQIRLLDGRTVSLPLHRYRRGRGDESRSGFQGRVGGILEREFPYDAILEEVGIPGERFVLDFWVPDLRLVVECQGRQHGAFVPFFHGTRSAFHRQQDRDSRKRRWCELNGLRFVEVPHDADDPRIAALVRGTA